MNTFSLRRVAQYATKHYAEYGRSYALYYGIVIAVLSVLALLVASKVTSYGEIELIYQTMLGTLPAIMLVVADLSVRSLYKRNNSAEIAMTLPLTSAERYTFVFLNTLIMGAVVPFAITYAFDFWDYLKTVYVSGLYIVTHPYVLVAYCWARRPKHAILGLVLLWAATMITLANISPLIGIPTFDNLLHFSLPDSYAFFKYDPIVYSSGIEFEYPTWVEWLYTAVMYALAYVIAYFKLRERRLA